MQMTLYEIPDSDDEEELGFGRSPRAVGEEKLESSKQRPDAMRSGSTDPEFFQTVYEEHREAVRQVSRSVKGRFQSAATNDPYDIPSSPEVDLQKRKSGLKGSCKSEEQGSTASPPERKRRRRLEEDADEVSLVRIPSPSKGGPYWDRKGIEPSATIDANLPSTLDPLQVPDERQQVHAPPSLSSSSFVPTQDQGPSASGRGGLLLIKSSGSATNINTPRSLPPSMPLDNNYITTSNDNNINNINNSSSSNIMQADAAFPGTVSRHVWPDSSPDLLASTVTPRQSGRGRGIEPQLKQMSPAVEGGQPERFNPPPKTEKPSCTSPEELVAKNPTHRKRQRGRPRKPQPEPEPQLSFTAEGIGASEAIPDTMNHKSVDVNIEAATAADSTGELPKQLLSQQPESSIVQNEETPQKPPKKKRGRPKRKERQVTSVDVKSPHVAAPTADAIEGAGRYEQEQPKARDDNKREISRETSELEGDLPVHKNIREGDDVPKKASTISAAKQNGPSSTAKPTYRVGLSKRSRIAPLLKIVRKD